jgi:hypothetical protein
MRNVIAFLVAILCLTPTAAPAQVTNSSLIGYARAESAGLPALEHAELQLSAAQQATLFSVPIELVAARTGKILYLTHIHVRKQAGTGWTTTSSGVLRVGHGAAFGSTFAQFDQATTTAFFGSSDAVWLAEAGKGQFAGFGDHASFLSGVSLKIWLTAADISGGTGNLIVNVWFRAWDGI